MVFRRLLKLALLAMLILAGFLYIRTSSPPRKPTNLLNGDQTMEAARDSQGPVVAWVYPVRDAEVFTVGDEHILIEAEAEDDSGVSAVAFTRWDAVQGIYVDIGRDMQPPYEWDLDTTTLNFEFNQLVIQAYDTTGNPSERAFIWLYRPNPFQPHYLPYVIKNLHILTSP